MLQNPNLELLNLCLILLTFLFLPVFVSSRHPLKAYGRVFVDHKTELRVLPFKPCNLTSDCKNERLYCERIDYVGAEERDVNIRSRVCLFYPDIEGLIPLKHWGLLRCDTDQDCMGSNTECYIRNESMPFSIRQFDRKKGLCVFHEPPSKICPDALTIFTDEPKCEEGQIEPCGPSSICFKGHCCPKNYQNFHQLMLVGGAYETQQKCDPKKVLAPNELHSYCPFGGNLTRMGRVTHDGVEQVRHRECKTFTDCEEDEVCGRCTEGKLYCFKYWKEKKDDWEVILMIVSSILILTFGTLAVLTFFHTDYYLTEEEIHERKLLNMELEENEDLELDNFELGEEADQKEKVE